MDWSVGRRIRQLRHAQKISSVKLADFLGKTYQQVQKYETGKNRISAGILYQVSRFLNCNVSNFFPDSQYSETETTLNNKKSTVRQFKKLFNQLLDDI